MTIKLNAKSFKNLLETIIREEKKKLNENNVEDLGNRPEAIAERFPKAYEALPSSYKNDSALTFYVDEEGNLCADHDLHNENYVWTGRKWVRGEFEAPSVPMESKKNDKNILKEIIKYRELLQKYPSAAKRLPYSFRNDPFIKFYMNNGSITAETNNKNIVWNGTNWSMKESKKITLGQVKRIIKEEVARFSLKQTLKEVFKRHCKVNESVNFGALKKELESGFDHFKAENPDVKVGDFNWDTAIKGLMQDDEARQMMKVGDADGLVNKAIELAGVENVAGDVDVEKHAEDVFGNLQGDEKVDDSDVDAAFDNIQRKSA